jgi:hypothetical protein
MRSAAAIVPHELCPAMPRAAAGGGACVGEDEEEVQLGTLVLRGGFRAGVGVG